MSEQRASERANEGQRHKERVRQTDKEGGRQTDKPRNDRLFVVGLFVDGLFVDGLFVDISCLSDSFCQIFFYLVCLGL